MKTEIKNMILTLNRKENKSLRQISKTLDIPLSTVQEFVSKNKEVLSFAVCPNCQKEITIKSTRGRPAMFCCYACKVSYYKKHDSLKTETRVCECCGKKYKQYRYLKTRFCSRQCAQRFNHGVR